MNSSFLESTNGSSRTQELGLQQRIAFDNTRHAEYVEGTYSVLRYGGIFGRRCNAGQLQVGVHAWVMPDTMEVRSTGSTADMPGSGVCLPHSGSRAVGRFGAFCGSAK